MIPLTGRPTISVIGLGRVGLAVAVAFAERGFQVIAFDIDRQRMQALENRGRSVRKGLSPAANGRDAALRSQISYLIVPTPADASGSYDTCHLRAACADIGRAIGEKSSYHLVVVASTLLPGATRRVLLPELERLSGKTCGPDFGLCYSPIFAALGQVTSDFLSPPFGLVGEFDRASGELLSACYGKLFVNGAPVKRMTIENAELVKIAINTFITTRIAFANMVGDLCEELPSGDAAVVLDAMGGDPRIGPLALKAGLGFGGPCFPRDNVAMNHLARSLGVSAEISRATHDENRRRTGRLLDRLPRDCVRGKRVAVLGLAYKTGSDVFDGSQSILVANELVRRGAEVIAYDSLTTPDAVKALAPTISVVNDLEACLSRARVVVVTLPEPSYADAVRRHALAAAEPLCIYDLWGIVGPMANPEVTLIVTGRETAQQIPLASRR